MAAEFKEIDRIALDSGNDIVVSGVYRDGEFYGWTFNTFVRTDNFTGFTKGVTLPKAYLDDFLELIDKVKEAREV